MAKKKTTKKSTTKKKTAKTASKAVTKKTTTKKKTSSKKKTSKKTSSFKTPSAAGKQLVIVESPAKAKTINRYLGPDFVVTASVGHVRDLPSKAPKGSKQPVPGVDLDNDFDPTYEVLDAKKKAVTDLKKAAKGATEIWFATDLDREGEAIAWHLANILGVKPSEAKRVVFNAITKDEIARAFEKPHPIDEYKVNAQQARRILDRIVGYQASPLLWKKVARGLSAGRVQSVATRLIVEREREIDAFIPDESWEVGVKLALDPATSPQLAEGWSEFISTLDDKGKGPTIKRQNAWLSDNRGLRTELVEVGGSRFSIGCKADAIEDLSAPMTDIAAAVGLTDVSVSTEEDATGKGPARFRRTVGGTLDPAARYAVESIETTRKSSKPFAPFITSLAAGLREQRARFRDRPHDADRPGPLHGSSDSGRGPGRSHHLHANRFDASLRRCDRAGSRVHRPAARRRLPAGEAPLLRFEQQGCAGGPRGDPADRPAPHPGTARVVAQRGAAEALSTHLEPIRRLPDDERPVGLDRDPLQAVRSRDRRRAQGQRPGARLRRLRRGSAAWHVERRTGRSPSLREGRRDSRRSRSIRSRSSRPRRRATTRAPW